MNALGTIFVVLILLVVGLMLTAAAVPAYMLMWGWFVTPAFGLEVPKFGLMFGLVMLFSMLTHKHRKDNSNDFDLDEALKVSITQLVGIWLSTGVAKFIHVLFV